MGMFSDGYDDLYWELGLKDKKIQKLEKEIKDLKAKISKKKK